MSILRHFLLVFDHKSDSLIKSYEFDDVNEATEEYSHLEWQYADDSAVDVVLVGSDSIETVKITHSNYFGGTSKSLMDRALNLYAS